jgi:hypothetical protein
VRFNGSFIEKAHPLNKKKHRRSRNGRETRLIIIARALEKYAKFDFNHDHLVTRHKGAYFN